MKTSIYPLLICLIIVSCTGDAQRKTPKSKAELIGLSKAYFAGGCFWCVEAIFQSVKGVEEAISGYAGGEMVNPSYELVSAGVTDHAETVEIYYDPNIVSYTTLLKVFFESHDPTTLNRQGPDSGTQYRSAIFYQTNEERDKIRSFIKKLESEGIFTEKIITEVTKLGKFYDAEAYHQEYEYNNPDNPYVQGVSIPRLNQFKEKLPELLKEDIH